MYPIPTSPENLDTREKLDDKIRKLLLGFGISEAYNFSFMSQEEANKFNLMGEENLISLDNPLNKELTTMRTGLFPSLLKNLITNHEKGNFNIALFEIGKSFWKETSYLERKNLGILLSGSMIATNWTTGELDADFFYMKGILEELFTGLQRKDISFERSVNPFLHPGKTASLILNGVKIGFFGELHPDVMMDQDIKKPTFYAELNLDALERTPEEPISYRKRSKYPAVEREIAFIVDQDTPAGNLKEIIQKESLLIQKAEAFDVYTGKPVPEGKKSVAFSFILQAEDRTLTDEEINKIMNSIIDKAKNQLGASLREG
jgi:phenylalanyl-tRNA synthetase beta chain